MIDTIVFKAFLDRFEEGGGSLFSIFLIRFYLKICYIVFLFRVLGICKVFVLLFLFFYSGASH